jgi:hypothetical protein
MPHGRIYSAGVPVAGGGGNTTLFGAGVPAPGLGAVGDTYFDTTAKNIYKKTAPLVWTLETSYLDTTLLYGAGVPAVGLGNVGDSYLDTAALILYSKTAPLVWTLEATLGGPSVKISNSLKFTGAVAAGATSPVIYTVPAGSYATFVFFSDIPVNTQFKIDTKVFGPAGNIAAGSAVTVTETGGVFGINYELLVVEFSN